MATVTRKYVSKRSEEQRAALGAPHSTGFEVTIDAAKVAQTDQQADAKGFVPAPSE